VFINRIAAIRERRSRIATTDLYFFNPLKVLGFDLGSVWPIGRNVYQVGSIAVISRYASNEELDAFQRRGISQVVYIADDDFAAGAHDTHLPEEYRRKLHNFVNGTWRRICDMADTVLVPSPRLFPYYGDRSYFVHPMWDVAPANTDHFNCETPLRIAYLGSRSHQQDLAMITPTLLSLLNERRDLTLTTWLGNHVPSELLSTGRVTAVQPQRWHDYKRDIVRRRFHLALYPLQPSAFNAARSSNKIFEHAVTGAASLMSPFDAIMDLPLPGVASVIVSGGAEEWRARIYAAVDSPLELKSSADQLNRQISTQKNGVLLEFWRKLGAHQLPKAK
jgi:hypothetical protein